MPLQRNTAYKLRIGDLLKGKVILDENRFRMLELGNRQIIRVNVVANVIDKFETESGTGTKYATLTIDDASGQIQIRAFGDDVKKFINLNQGDTIMVIGNLRFFNNELYILPEIIKIKEPAYLVLRKLEIEKQNREMGAVEVQTQETKALRDQIADMIKGAEPDSGVDVDKIIMQMKAEPNLINQEIQKLLEEGVIYEPRPGRVRYLG